MVRRRPRSVYGVGSAPDPRFSLANERTALAWVRTGLGAVAAGVALTSLAAFGGLPRVVDVVACVCSLTGGVLAASSMLGWARAERALRLGEPLPPPRMLPVVATVVLVVSLVLVVSMASRLW